MGRKEIDKKSVNIAFYAFKRHPTLKKHLLSDYCELISNKKEYRVTVFDPKAFQQLDAQKNTSKNAKKGFSVKGYTPIDKSLAGDASLEEALDKAIKKHLEYIQTKMSDYLTVVLWDKDNAPELMIQIMSNDDNDLIALLKDLGILQSEKFVKNLPISADFLSNLAKINAQTDKSTHQISVTDLEEKFIIDELTLANKDYKNLYLTKYENQANANIYTKKAVTQTQFHDGVEYTYLHFQSWEEKLADTVNLDKLVFKIGVPATDLANFVQATGVVVDTSNNIPSPYFEVFLVNVKWISQFDKSIFGNCIGCWKYRCCLRACVYMLGKTHCANCSDKKIAKSNPIKVKAITTIAKFVNDKDWKTLYDSKQLSLITSKAYGLIKENIDNKKSSVIGVHYTNRGKEPPGNSNKATYHFMIAMGYGNDEKGKYIRFYDPGTLHRHKGKNKSNKLYLNNQGFLKGDYNNKIYTITQIYNYE